MQRRGLGELAIPDPAQHFLGFSEQPGHHRGRQMPAGRDQQLDEDQQPEHVPHLRPDPAPHQQSGIPFSAFMPLFQPRQLLKVIVYDPGSDKVGSRLVRKIR